MLRKEEYIIFRGTKGYPFKPKRGNYFAWFRKNPILEKGEFAIAYYYNILAKQHGISQEVFRQTLDYFLFYEYCEWIMLGNRYDSRDDERYGYYLNLAEKLAKKLI